MEIFEKNIDELLKKVKKREVPFFISEVISNVKDLKPFCSVASSQYSSASNVYNNGKKNEYEGMYEVAKNNYYLAKDLDCAVVLHTESKANTFKELAEIADFVGIKKEKVVKHFSPPIVDTKKNFGLFPSIIATEKNIKKAILQGNRFLLETDYIDDLDRPGAVLGLKSVPKKTKLLFEKGGLRRTYLICDIYYF